jgi:single-stranded-DNA-specific exonuclease RecJ
MALALLTEKPSIWQYRGGSPDVDLPAFLLDVAQQQQVLARLLYNRNLHSLEEALAFLKPADPQDLRPVEELPDAEQALLRIEQALDSGEHILIYGDFDVDGITGTSIFYETLHHRLKANVSFYIPDRANEGHGLHASALLRLTSTRQVKLVITTDTGISNFNEISLLNGLKVDTIVTDHHELPEHLPLAVANVNPQRFADAETHRLGHLSGAGVAYKLCSALLKRRLPVQDAQDASDALLDLCAIGLVADMVPLVGENRLLVRLGLEQLNKRRRLGLDALLKNAGVGENATLNAESIGFTIGPRLNALGRLQNATEGVEFLTTTELVRATELALLLEGLNRQRQELCDKTYIEAEQHLRASGGIEGRKAIILASPDWNLGVIGIVASRLIEKYKLPTFMMVVEEAQNKVRCSARSISGFHLTEHLEKLSPYFLHMGGHAGAAGFALPLEKLKNFKEALWALANETLDDDMTRPVIEVDAKIGFDALHVGFVDALESLAPYGMRNPSPIFVLENVKVASQRSLGSTANHLKVMFEPAERQGFIKGQLQSVEALLWKCGVNFKLDASKRYHVACTIEKNTYGMGTPVRLTIKDLKIAGEVEGALRPAVVHETQEHEVLPASVPLTPPVMPPPPLAPSLKRVSPRLPVDQDAHWLDHRKRSNPAEFIAELLMTEKSHTLIYNEGKAPPIPFVEASHYINRQTLQPCHSLILWDLPPSQALLDALIHTSQAKELHLFGAKYQDVDLTMPLATFLKAMNQGLQLLLNKASQLQGLPLETLASRFATTEEILLVSLLVLNLQTQCFETSVVQGNIHVKRVQQGAEVDWMQINAHEPSVLLLERLRQESVQFRQSLLTRVV